MWQYLRRAELHKVVDRSNSPWHKLRASSEHLGGMTFISLCGSFTYCLLSCRSNGLLPGLIPADTISIDND